MRTPVRFGYRVQFCWCRFLFSGVREQASEFVLARASFRFWKSSCFSSMHHATHQSDQISHSPMRLCYRWTCTSSDLVLDFEAGSFLATYARMYSGPTGSPYMNFCEDVFLNCGFLLFSQNMDRTPAW